VAKWQTQQTQNLPGRKPRVGSNPTSGTRLNPTWHQVESDLGHQVESDVRHSNQTNYWLAGRFESDLGHQVAVEDSVPK
jgi:hypothetical protein